QIGSVTHQPAGFYKLAPDIGGRNPIVRCECRKLDSSGGEEPVRTDEKGVGTIECHGGEGRFDLAAGAGVENLNLKPDCAGRFRHISYVDSVLMALVGLTSTATRTALGTSSRNSPSRLARTSEVKKLMPVALPPGRARLATKPCATGSPLTPKAIGIVAVAALAASVEGSPIVAITATRRRTRSDINGGRRSFWPLSQWYS